MPLSFCGSSVAPEARGRVSAPSRTSVFSSDVSVMMALGCHGDPVPCVQLPGPNQRAKRRRLQTGSQAEGFRPSLSPWGLHGSCLFFGLVSLPRGTGTELCPGAGGQGVSGLALPQGAPPGCL